MNLLYLTILLPLLGFLLLAFSRGRWSENLSAIVGVGSVGLAALITCWLAIDFYANNADGGYVYRQTLWHWIAVDNFNIPITLVLDGLSLTMLAVVTGVGFLIHLYASWYMRGEEGYSRFFAYTNLFIASMVILVLADNMLLMYLGWEGVDQERVWLQPKAWIGPAILSAVLLGVIVYAIVAIKHSQIKGEMISAKQVGISLFGPYVLAVELVSLLLLAGLVVAFHIGREKRLHAVDSHSEVEEQV